MKQFYNKQFICKFWNIKIIIKKENLENNFLYLGVAGSLGLHEKLTIRVNKLNITCYKVT